MNLQYVYFINSSTDQFISYSYKNQHNGIYHKMQLAYTAPVYCYFINIYFIKLYIWRLTYLLLLFEIILGSISNNYFSICFIQK